MLFHFSLLLGCCSLHLKPLDLLVVVHNVLVLLQNAQVIVELVASEVKLGLFAGGTIGPLFKG